MSNNAFKKSQFNIEFRTSGKFLIYNTASSALCELEDDFVNEYVDKEIWYRDDKFFQELKQQGFIVNTDTDEVYSQQIIRIGGSYQNDKKLSYITIMPTTTCNARCYYCYEKNMNKKTMSQDIVEATIRFIIEKVAEDKKFHISWHGGEPLLVQNIIDKISIGLKEAGISLTCSMNTNGVLFDKTVVKKAKELWGMSHLQVTLDGTEEVYNRTKSYVVDFGNPFKKVIENIHLLSANGIRVNIRHNVNYDRVQDTLNVIEYVAKEFKNDSNVIIYPAPIYGEETKVIKTKEHPLLTVYKKLEECGYFPEWDSSYLLPRNGVCSACTSNSYMIAYNGKLYKCQHVPVYAENEDVGDVFNGVTFNQEYKKWTKCDLPYEECVKCKLLPCCQGGCLAALNPKEKRKCCIAIKPILDDYMSLAFKNIKRR